MDFTQKNALWIISTWYKLEGFWYQKQCFGLFCILYIVLFGVKSFFNRNPLLILSEKNSSESVLVLFLVPKAVHLTLSQPVLGCMGLFGVHFIAIKGFILLATSFVYSLLKKLLYMLFCTCCKFAAYLYQNSALDFIQSVHLLLATRIVVPELIVSEKELCFWSFLVPKTVNFFATCTGVHWCALHC